MEFSRFPRCGKDADKQKQEYVKSIRDDIKKKIKGLAEDVFYSPSAVVIKDLIYIYPMLKCLCSLVSDFSIRYTAKKRRKQLLDFNDLEHLCLQILTAEGPGFHASPTEETGETGETDETDETENRPLFSFMNHVSPVARQYKERFEEILVDEYQDSNLVQEILIHAISRVDDGKPNIFMVGDVKQSIYRFRQAKPELFLDKYNTYSPEAGSGYRKIKLFKNFRSRVLHLQQGSLRLLFFRI